MAAKAIVALVNVLVLVLVLCAIATPSMTSDGINVIEQWNKTLGGTGDDYGYFVQQTADGGYIIAGYTHSYDAGDADIWLIKTDTNGTEEWNRTFGGAETDLLDRGSVRQTSDGGYIITGYTYSYGAGDADAWLIKTDKNGTEVWNRTFGGEALDWGHSVQQTSDGGYIIAGRTDPYAGARADAWLIKTNSNGVEEWNRTFGTDACEYAASVQQTSDSGYIITGRTTSYGAGGADAWLIRTDCNGIEEWNRTFGGAGYDYGYSVQQTLDGGYIVAGSTNNRQDIWLIKTDAGGMEEWNSILGGPAMDEEYSVQQTADGGYIAAGYTASYGAGSGDVWLVKTDSNGNEQWNKTFGGTNLDEGYSVQQTADGGYIAAGFTNSYGSGYADIWLIKIKLSIAEIFDTGPGTCPSIMGEHKGTITPKHDIFVEQMYTYPCEGTGGHTEYAKIYNDSLSVETLPWEGYKGDWHNISFNQSFTLVKNKTYNYTIVTGSYPQIHHTPALPTTNGWINCTEFSDANGKKYDDWIPAIKLLGAKISPDTREDLGNLTEDFYNLPEIADGISEKELNALKQIAVLTKSNDTEVQRGLQVIDKYGVPGYVFDHPEGWIPDYNTQLEVLLWLAENRTIVDGYDRISLCLALDYGSVVTIGDDQVDQSVRQYVLDIYDYVKETDEVLRERNVSWRAKDYPLDADVGLCWGANKLRYPTFYEYAGQDPGQPWMHYWREEFRDRQMNIEDFNWLFASKGTLEEMREWAFDNGLVNRSNMGETAELIDVFVNWHHKYYTDKLGIPPSYFEVEGKITPGCRISNPNWQWEYFKQNGTIIGNCEDLCFADCMFLQSLDIGKYAGGVRSESFGHHVILYCDTENNVLKTTSRQIDIIDGHATPPIMYMGYKVPWDNFYIYSYGTYSFWITSGDKELLKSGIPFSYLAIE